MKQITTFTIISLSLPDSVTLLLLEVLLLILCRAASSRLAPHYCTLGDLEWEVDSTTVTHSSADWWDLLLPLA